MLTIQHIYDPSSCGNDYNNTYSIERKTRSSYLVYPTLVISVSILYTLVCN